MDPEIMSKDKRIALWAILVANKIFLETISVLLVQGEK